MEMVIAIATKLAKYTVEPIGQLMCYLFCYKNKVAELEEQVRELGDEISRVQHSVDTARRNGEEIEDDVKKWLGRVDEVAAKAKELFEAKTSCLNFSSRYQLSRKAKKIAQDVKIQKERKFNSVSYGAPIQWISSTEGYVAFESRKSVVNEIMQALTDANTNRIGVYGMGGVGKTMLVKEVAAKAKEKKVFDEVFFATVSQTPSKKEIQGVIADKLGLKFTEETIEGRAERLRERLEKEKNVLVIIDDIWEKFDLQAVGISFGNDHKGCKFLFTSRSEEVLRNYMNTDQKTFGLRVLSHDEARNLFGKIVGGLADDPDFCSLAKEVVKECAGLPIAITTVASALKLNSLPRWKDALQQLRRSNPTNISGMDDKVYSSIKLSYNFLKGEEAKSLFLLCSLYKEDYNIDVESLLRYGMGLDLFQDVYHLEEVRNRVYTLVENLKLSCLLLNGDRDNTVKMHDIIRDVSIHIAAKDKNMLNIGNDVHLQEWSKNKKLKDSTAISLPFTDVCELPESLECPKLILFLLFNKNRSWQIPHPFFEGVKELRVLNLTEMLCPHLPLSLSFLQNLQTLCLDGCELEDVALIGELKNLKVLSLKNSNIKQLPKQIGQLTHLQLLDLSNCKNLEIIPANVLSNLKKLEELYLKNSFNGWEGEGQSTEGSNARLTELDHLSHLTTLNINIPSPKVMPKALIFENLVRYKICIGDRGNGYWFYKTSTALKLKLDISCQLVDGIKILLKSCEDLCLDKLEGVQNILYELNSDGFPLLKHLNIQDNVEIQYIINSMGLQSTIVFPVLESFSLYRVINLEKICHGQLAMGSFRSLRILTVLSCDNLKFVFSLSMAECFTQLQEIRIIQCKVMGSIVETEREDKIDISDGTTNMMEFTQLRSLSLKSLPKLMSFGFDVDSRLLFNEKVALPNLENLEIDSVDNLTMICHNQLVPNDSFCKLKILTVKSCGSLKSLFPASMAKRLIQLEKLEISLCKALEDIVAKEEGLETKPTKFVFPRLTSLELDNVLFPKLEYLQLHDLPKLTRFCSENVIELPSLKELEINKCPELKTFIFNSLCTDLTVNNELEEINNNSATMSLFNEKVALPNLENLEIHSMDNLTMICHNQLVPNDSFCKLKRLTVKSCGSLKSLFPASMAKRLIQLEKLEISLCKALEDIVAKEEGLEIEPNKFVFPQLTSLELNNLVELKSFYPAKHTLEWPSLKVLKICYCNKVKMFASDSTSSLLDITIQQPFLKNTLANLEELNLEWNDAMNETRHGQFPAELFPKVKVIVLHFSNSESAVFVASFVHGLSNLEKLTLRGDLIEEICLYKGRFPISLGKLELYDMPKLMHLWNEDSQTGKVFQNLEVLGVQRCSGLKNLEPFPIISLQNLKTLTVFGCDGLINLVTSSTAKTLVQLREMTIRFCKNITEIVANEGGEAGDPEIVFSQLNDLVLGELPRLISFHPGNCTMKFPSLKAVYVIACPELKIFSRGVLSTPKLSALVTWSRETSSFYPDKDDLNNNITQDWESRNNKKNDQNSEEP